MKSGLHKAGSAKRDGIFEGAIFLDRDGTIIEDSGYLADPAGVKLLPGVKRALQSLRRRYSLFLFSNQSGIGRGYYSWDEADAVNSRMLELLGLGEGVFEDICMAAERPDEPVHYRKPSPRYILESAAVYGLDLRQSWMVGDRLSDLQAGIRAGCRSALVRTTELAEREEVREYCRRYDIPVFGSLAEFASELVSQG